MLLKYRVPDEGRYPKSERYPDSPMALEDVQQTVGLIRFHAAGWRCFQCPEGNTRGERTRSGRD